MAIIIALIVGSLALLAFWVYSTYTYWQRRGILHDKPHLIGGNMHEWGKKKPFAQIFREIYDKYKTTGPFVGFYLFLTKAVVITDLEMVKTVLIKDFNKFDERGLYHNAVDDPLSAHMFALDGNTWRPLRHKISPTFTSGKMKFMFPTVLAVGQELVKSLNLKLKETQNFEITDILGRFTADVIGSCAFGLECNSLHNPTADFVVMGRIALTQRRHGQLLSMLMFGYPALARALHLKDTRQDVEDFYMGIIKNTISYRRKNNIKRNDFMDMLIELNQKYLDGNHIEGLSLEELAAQAFVFFIAGFETSSTTMGFALYELAQNQEIQSKLREEINEVLSKHNNDFTYECMKEMKYLEMVIYETLRKYPIVAHLVRKTNDNYVSGDLKYYIEKGTTVLISTLGIHHDADIYPEPEKFIPERFTQEDIQARPACSWLPFGDGPRNCIGLRFGKMQACIGLAYLIKNFQFELSPETQTPLQFAKTSILLRSDSGIHLKAKVI